MEREKPPRTAAKPPENTPSALVVQNRGSTALEITPTRKSAAKVYLDSLRSKDSRVTMEGVLRRIVAELTVLAGGTKTHTPTIDEFKWGGLRYEHTSALAAVLQKQMAPATFNKHLAGLRQTMKTARRLGQMGADDFARAADIKNAEGDEGAIAGRAVTVEEIQKLVDVCPTSTWAGKRDAAIVMVLALAGLRRAELAGLNLSNYSNGYLDFRGKRNKRRRLSVASIAGYINEWLTARAADGGSQHDGSPLFTNAHLGRLSTKGVWEILNRLQLAAKIPPITPHDMRRGFITNMLARGEDVLTVSKMAGHSNPATTRRYDRRGDEAADAAIARQVVPTRKPQDKK